jgi:hypothetical protein
MGFGGMRATTFAMAGARGQSASEVTVRVSARQTCVAGSIDLPCHDVGAKLRDQSPIP